VEASADQITFTFINRAGTVIDTYTLLPGGVAAPQTNPEAQAQFQFVNYSVPSAESSTPSDLFCPVPSLNALRLD
jgi:hypothetical protein